MHLTRGFLVNVEGIDGSGKSSLMPLLEKKLQENGFDPLLTKEPGGSELGRYLRKVLQEHPVKVDSKAEFLLFAADRAQHFADIIMPNLLNNKLVISDRMADSAVAYQGYGRNLDVELIKQINAWAMNGEEPDLTIYLQIDVDTALSRCNKRGLNPTSFEKEHRSFFERIKNGYEQTFKLRNNVIYIDASQPQPQVVDEVYTALTNHVHNHSAEQQTPENYIV